MAKGLDTDLPEAQFREKEGGKLAVYQAAQRDSSGDGVSPDFLRSLGMKKDTTAGLAANPGADEQALLIQQKLAALQRQLGNPVPEAERPYYSEPAPNRRTERTSPPNVQAEDPELRQLDKMLDKIQAIQNPAAAVPQEKPKSEPANPFRAIRAAIDGKQKVADGAAVKLKLTDTATIKGQLFGAGQALYGVGQVANQRLLITVRNIRVGDNIIPVDLTVFGTDGMPGIPAPEAELGGAVSNGADNAIQSMQVMTMDQSLGAQAAAGGINAAKGLFSKKIKKIRVKLSDDQAVLLKLNN
ncbi:hypothetical protein BC343_19585 [Mucilaginibacter pedocola]|uniref:Conjugative transposon TraM C-terminal domain-containing protein n=2 Tax=Mucilaginibacter pedocola TaxID=1792845 RepID=A0A1S9P6U9_9SPHI|nr:hypothetical protein BC343_19585 [Mucilaginibacter pedocola]